MNEIIKFAGFLLPLALLAAGNFVLSSQFCLIDTDCPVGQKCLLHPGYGLVGRLNTRTLLRGVCAPPPAGTISSEASEVTGFEVPAPARQQENLLSIPPAWVPGWPQIECNNFQENVLVGENLTITTQGEENDIYNITIPTGANLFVKVKEFNTHQEIPGAFTFFCDDLGAFKLKFKIFATDAFNSLQGAVTLCYAQINCLDETALAALEEEEEVEEDNGSEEIQSTNKLPLPLPPPSRPMPRQAPPTPPIQQTQSSYNGGQDMGLHTMKGNAPEILCLPFRSSLKVGKSKTIALIDNVFVIADSGSMVNVMVKDTITMSAIPGVYTASCSRPGLQQVVLAVTAVSETGLFDMALCGMEIVCEGNSAPTVHCATPHPVAKGPVGSSLAIDVTGPHNQLFQVHDKDGDKVLVGLQDSQTGELLWNLQHTCREPGLVAKSITVSAFDGEDQSTAQCGAAFDCL